MKNNAITALVFTLIASLLPTIIAKECLGGIPFWLPLTQIAILTGVGIYLGFIKKLRQLSKYTAVLAAAVV